MNPIQFSRTRHCLVALASFALAVLPLAGQTNPPPAPGRYLFIVDTSAAMKRYAPAMYKAVENLLLSSMSAQLKRGDTVGVWTFNEQLNAGRLPLQVWSPETAGLVNTNVISFLKTQAYSGASRFEAVVPTLSRVVESSERLTVLLVSDGNEEISGTPFDWQIQTALGNSFKAQQKARMPFITVIRAVQGEFVSAIVNRAPWPVEFPNFPTALKTASAPKPTPKPKPLVTNTVPPLILIGKKPEPTVETNPPPVFPQKSVEPTTPAVSQSETPVTAAPTNLGPSAIVEPVKETNAPVIAEARINPATNVSPTPPDEPKSAAVVTGEPAPNAATPTATRAQAAALPAVALPATNHWIMICGGIVMVLMAIVIIILVVQRGQSRGESSLITRSMDQDKK